MCLFVCVGASLCPYALKNTYIRTTHVFGCLTSYFQMSKYGTRSVCVCECWEFSLFSLTHTFFEEHVLYENRMYLSNILRFSCVIFVVYKQNIPNKREQICIQMEIHELNKTKESIKQQSTAFFSTFRLYFSVYFLLLFSNICVSHITLVAFEFEFEYKCLFNILNWIEGKQNLTIKWFVLIKVSMRQALELVFLREISLDWIESGFDSTFLYFSLIFHCA